jgi:uncharacterized cupin superfamily protein
VNQPLAILRHFLHVRDDGRADVIPVTASFWEDVAGGAHPQLEHGRLLSAFTFSEPWSSWERHPAGEELVMLLSGRAEVLLEDGATIRSLSLETPGDYALVPAGAWHTARTAVATTMLFLTPGAGTEHRPA